MLQCLYLTVHEHKSAASFHAVMPIFKCGWTSYTWPEGPGRASVTATQPKIDPVSRHVTAAFSARMAWNNDSKVLFPVFFLFPKWKKVILEFTVLCVFHPNFRTTLPIFSKLVSTLSLGNTLTPYHFNPIHTITAPQGCQRTKTGKHYHLSGGPQMMQNLFF